jgi:ketosteroid isomerase-like protein
MLRYLLAGVLGIAIGAIGMQALRSPAHPTAVTTNLTSDSAAAVPGIAALHHADSVATISGDGKALADLWDDAAIRIEPGSAATVSKAAIVTADSQFHANSPGGGPVTYAPHFFGLAVRGDMAVEWGYFDTDYVPSRGAKPTSLRGNVLRVMRRQPNGEWKFTHVIWNRAR